MADCTFIGKAIFALMVLSIRYGPGISRASETAACRSREAPMAAIALSNRPWWESAEGSGQNARRRVAAHANVGGRPRSPAHLLANRCRRASAVAQSRPMLALLDRAALLATPPAAAALVTHAW